MMARIRSVHPGLASDEAFMSMSMAGKAAWPLLWTECDDNGVFEWKPIVLKARIFPADNIDFAEILAELEALECVKRFSVEGKHFGVVRNFGKYQRPKNPSYRFTLPDEHRLYAGFAVNPTPVLPEPSPSPTENPPQLKEEGDKREEEEGKEKQGVAPANADAAREGSIPVLKATRLEPDWQPSAETLAHGKAIGLSDDDLDRSLARFRNHWLGTTGTGSMRTDWNPAFMNWIEGDAAKRHKPSAAPMTVTPVESVFVGRGTDAWKAWVSALGKEPFFKFYSIKGRNQEGAFFRTEYPEHEEAAA